MEPKGFFAKLFDFSFSEFITTKIIKILYGIGMALSVVWVISFIVAGFMQSALMGILVLILSPVVFLLFIILLRVCLEIIIVIFRIAKNTGEIAKK